MIHRNDHIRAFQKVIKRGAAKHFHVTFAARYKIDIKEEGIAYLHIREASGGLGVLRESLRLIHYFLTTDATILHICSPRCFFLIPLGYLLGKTVVYDMHENQPLAIVSKPYLWSWIRRPLSILYGLAERVLLHDTRVIFAELSYSKYYKWIKKSVVALNMPILSLIDRDSSGVVRPRDQVIIGYCGAISVKRGALELIETFSILRKTRPDIRLEFIGEVEPGFVACFQDSVRRTGYQDDIVIHGYKVPTEMYSIMARWHIGVAVLHPEPNYFESYPTKIFEYMALGMPFVTSDFPLYKEVVRDSGGGLCIAPLEEGSLLGALEKLIGDGGLREQLGRNGRSAVETRYNWDIESAKLGTFYRSIGTDRFYNVI